MIALIAGVIGNIATERYLEWESERLPSVKTFFRNHDLTKLVGQSLGMVLRSCSEQLSNRDDNLTVLELAQTLEHCWPEIANSPWAYQWLAQIRDDQIVDFIRDPKKPALTNEQVDALFREINPKNPGENPVFIDPHNAETVREEL